MKAELKNLDNKKLGDVDINEAIFGCDIDRQDIMHRVVNWQLAKRRCGNHKVKDVSEISGTGKKPFAQKGTGNARQGQKRSGIQVGGQTTHGPVVRSHAFDVPKKVRKLALKTALSTKQASGKLIILDEAKTKSHKTRDLVSQLSKMGLTSALIIDGPEMDVNFVRAASNIPLIDVLPEQGANVYDILRRDVLVLTKAALTNLEARLK